MKKILIAVLVIACAAYFIFMTSNSSMNYTAKLADNHIWTSATYEFIEGEEAELDISFTEDGKVKIKGPNKEMKVLITFMDDKYNKAKYEYIIYDDGVDQDNKVELNPCEE